MSDIIELSEEMVIRKIYKIRGQQVMIDRDLAELYQVKTKVLKQAVRRNLFRFPKDFMFEMSKEELAYWRSQFVTSNSIIMGLRYPPFCFTESGVAMLSSVLKSDRAIIVNIHIIRVFVNLRKMLLTSKDLLLKMGEIEEKVADQDKKIKLVFDYLRQFIEKKEKLRRRIGFKS